MSLVRAMLVPLDLVVFGRRIKCAFEKMQNLSTVSTALSEIQMGPTNAKPIWGVVRLTC